MLDEKIPDCDYCELKFWGTLKKIHGDPPCFSCKMPDLMVANFFAWKVFATCSSQMRVVGMGTPMGIEFPAIDRAMDLVGIPDEDRDETFEKVRMVGEAYAEHVRRRQETDRSEQERASGRSSTRSAVMMPPMHGGRDRARNRDV